MNAELKEMDECLVETMEKESEKLERDSFARRHIGPRPEDVKEMLKVVGASTLDELISKTVPENIRLNRNLSIGAPLSENESISAMREYAKQNKLFRSYIGLGYSNTITPPVIQRNILENPGWYTQYTPYQAEISQGRLEALINYQTVISDLTKMDIANASLLDEGTAAAEAMAMFARVNTKNGRNKFFVSSHVHPQTLEVVRTRANPLGIELVVGDSSNITLTEEFFGALVQYPATDGTITSYESFTKAAHEAGALVVVASDLLALTLLTPPGEWGADAVVGNSQRFGVPFGFGGPHAGFFATREAYKRDLPGRIVGASKDSSGKSAFRLALQTREQHIRRDKATSNICTAQVLLAIMAGMYAVFHGPDGLRKIANRVHELTKLLRAGLKNLGVSVKNETYFDTLHVDVSSDLSKEIIEKAQKKQMNFRVYPDGTLGISLDETTTLKDIRDILEIFSADEKLTFSIAELLGGLDEVIKGEFVRKSEFLTHEVFSQHRSETEFLRYVKRLESKDLSLTTSMIPLGSCTMKLNASAEMYPITFPELCGIHPFAPLEQAKGWLGIIKELEDALADISGFAAVSLQPNAGSQGEYAGLLCIKAWHEDRGDTERNICLIPQSAHGTNPASAALAGMKVVVVKCDDDGNINVEDLRAKAEQYKDTLSSLMVTYPSTHGVFEETIKEVCQIIHDNGGQVYMDGANLNAQVGLCSPGDIGADVCHINLHKTFCIPHGGGGPGVGPIGVAKHLVPFLPGHMHGGPGGEKAIGAVASAPWGSAGILPISLAYIKMMGSEGLVEATKYAILNANYIAKRLEESFPVLYKGDNGFIAHECILDLRKYRKEIGIDVSDVAKRLMDFGFHAPTVSFPVVETLMVEPTESESKEELDRFCDALIAIRAEIKAVEDGKVTAEDSMLRHAPHTAQVVTADNWDRKYSRSEAAYPLSDQRQHKYWPPVGRIDNVYGDRNLFCSCVPMEAFEEE